MQRIHHEDSIESIIVKGFLLGIRADRLYSLFFLRLPKHPDRGVGHDNPSSIAAKELRHAPGASGGIENQATCWHVDQGNDPFGKAGRDNMVIQRSEDAKMIDRQFQGCRIPIGGTLRPA